MSAEISQGALQQIAAAHAKYQRDEDREAREQAVAQAVGHPPSPLSASATATIANWELAAITVFIGDHLGRRIFKASDGTGIIINGTFYYRQLEDLVGEQWPVTITFGSGKVVISIPPGSYFVGDWNEENPEPPAQRGAWS